MTLSFDTDNFRLIYTGIATFMWIVSLILSVEYMEHYERKGRYYVFTLITYLATVGVFLSGDLYTMFIFFEIMSLSSYVWVAFDERKESLRAAQTYLAVSVIGGLVMLMGLFLIYDVMTRLTPGSDITSALAVDRLKLIFYGVTIMGEESLTRKLWAGGLCMLIGFGAKAGAFPIHIWLPKAHPVAPAPASALLSGMLTKTGILGIILLTRYIFGYTGLWAALILITGVCTMAVGALLALFSTDIKRTLACSSVSQIGFIMTGLGAGSIYVPDMGISGAYLHMIGHSIFKLILFLTAGVIYMNTHRLDLDGIRGFGRRKPLLHMIFLSGALGIGGVPLFNGYISKTLIHESITGLRALCLAYGGDTIISYGAASAIEWIFLISGGCTVAYMLKLYICVFIEKNTDSELQAAYDERRPYMNRLTATALTVSAIIPPMLGLTPGLTMNGLARLSVDFLNMGATAEYALNDYFTWECLKGGLISLAIGIVLYAGIIRTCMMSEDKSRYVDIWPKWADLEELIYRPVLQYALPFAGAVVCRFLDCITDSIIYAMRKTVLKDSLPGEELSEGNMLTHALGVAAGRVGMIRRRRLKARGIRTGKPVNYVHRFAMLNESLKESRMVIFRSMSFGLMMFCLGLLVTVAYILITRWW